MTVVSVSRTIPATPAEVFALLADPAKHSVFDGSGTVQQAFDVAGPLKLGATFGMGMKKGIGYQMVNTVVEFEQDKRIAWQPRPALGFLKPLIGGRIWRYELEPVEGGTKVTESWDIRQERIPLLVRPLAGTAKKDMTATLERLETVLSS